MKQDALAKGLDELVLERARVDYKIATLATLLATALNRLRGIAPWQERLRRQYDMGDGLTCSIQPEMIQVQNEERAKPLTCASCPRRFAKPMHLARHQSSHRATVTVKTGRTVGPTSPSYTGAAEAEHTEHGRQLVQQLWEAAHKIESKARMTKGRGRRKR